MTPKEARFCDEYAVDQCGSKAAARAGYAAHSANRAAYKILQKPEIKKRIAEIQFSMSAETMITRNKVLLDLETQRIEAVAVGQMSAAIRASELQGKHIGMWPTRVEHSGPNGGPVQRVALTADEFREIAKAIADEV